MGDIFLFDGFGEELFIPLTEYELQPHCTANRRRSEKFANEVFDYDQYEFENAKVAAVAAVDTTVIPETPQRDTTVIPETPEHDYYEPCNLVDDIVWYAPPPDIEMPNDAVLISPASVDTVTSIKAAEENKEEEKKMYKYIHNRGLFHYTFYSPEKLNESEVRRRAVQAFVCRDTIKFPIKPQVEEEEEKKHKKHKHKLAASCKSKFNNSSADNSSATLIGSKVTPKTVKKVTFVYKGQ
jgi:hypothetical protein